MLKVRKGMYTSAFDEYVCENVKSDDDFVPVLEISAIEAKTIPVPANVVHDYIINASGKTIRNKYLWVDGKEINWMPPVTITAYFIIGPSGLRPGQPLSGFTDFRNYVRRLNRGKSKAIIVKLVNGVVTKTEPAEY